MANLEVKQTLRLYDMEMVSEIARLRSWLYIRMNDLKRNRMIICGRA